MKVLIELDMEGCAGVFDWAYTLKATDRLAGATRQMTDEANAAVAAAAEAGAETIGILESHPVALERMDPRAQLIRQDLYRLDARADALLFVGRHARWGVADGILNHTGSSRSIRWVRVNGRPFGELALTAAWFGAQGVPVAFVAGDEAACQEARDLLGDVETAAVKVGDTCHSGRSLSPEAACGRIRDGVGRALRRLSDFTPFRVEGPVTLEIEYRHSEVADWICRACGFERVDACVVRSQCPDYQSAFRIWYAQGPALARFDA